MESLNQLKPIMYWAGICFFLLLEIGFSYRSPSVSKRKRWFTNLPLSIINGTIYHLLFTASLINVAAHATKYKIGLLHNFFSIPEWCKLILSILILDFFIYLWHLLTHSLPILWRFHRVHHSDMNMDVSTASRFHLGEFLFTGFIRLAVIYTFGIPWTAYMLFEIMVNLSVQFHHSAIKMNPNLERIWIILFVPPCLHRIHHSMVRKDCDSNYGVIFSIWDRMTGTLNNHAEQEKIIIGTPQFQNFELLGFWHLLVMPFKK